MPAVAGARRLHLVGEDLREKAARPVRDVLLRYPPKPLALRIDDADPLDAAVRHAAGCFASALSRPVPDVPPLPDEAARWPVLSLHVWALLAVLSAPREPMPATAADLWRDLLGHEARYWRLTADGANLGELDRTTLHRSVGLVTLVATTSEQETVQALIRVPELADADSMVRHRVTWWLRRVYPGQPSEWLGRLAPDVLAEHHVVEQLVTAPEFARRALTGLSGGQAVHALTVLGRALAHRLDAADVITTALGADLAAMALPALEAARRTGRGLGRLLAAAVASSTASPVLLEELDRRTPVRSEALRDLRILLLHRRLASLRSGSPDEADLQIELGRLLVLSGEVDEAYRLARAAQASGATLVLRARALELESEAQYAAGQTAPALALNGRAIALFRERSTDRLDASPLHLADALILRSNLLTDMEDLAEAEIVARDAIECLQTRPSDGSDWRLAVARAQVSLSNILWRTDRHEEDLPTIRGAVATLRTLVSLDSDQHLAELGIALDQFGVRLAMLKHHDEAAAHTREAVQIFRRLARDNPVLYSGLLATTLHNLAVRVGEYGRDEEALRLAQEAVELRRPLAYAPTGIVRLVRALNNLGAWQQRLGQHDAALAALEEAAQLCAQVGSDGQFEQDAGCTLTALASLRAKDSPEASLEMAKEAVALLRSAADRGQPGGRSALAQAVSNVAGIQAWLGDVPATVACYEEAARLWLHLADDAPRTHAEQACQVLEAVLMARETNGAPELDPEAFERATEWTVEAARRLRQLAPESGTAVLARALEAGARAAAAGGHHDRALATATEAVELASRATEMAPGNTFTATDLLPRCLNALGSVLLDAGRRIEAIDAFNECVQATFSGDPDGSQLVNTGRTLASLGELELSVGRHADAAGHLTAAVCRLAEAPDLDNSVRQAIFNAGIVCLQAMATSGRPAAAIACSVITLGNSGGATAKQVCSCLELLCQVVRRFPEAAAEAWREVTAAELPGLLAEIASRPAGSDDDPAGAAEPALTDVARRFAATAVLVVADGERALMRMRYETPAAALARVLQCAARAGLRRGLRISDLVRLAEKQHGREFPGQAAAEEATAAGMLRQDGDRVLLTPYLLAACRAIGDAPDPAADLVALAEPGDLIDVARTAEAAGRNEVAEAALTRGVELGDRGAMHNLAYRLHQRGKPDEAVALYERAANLGAAESMVALGAHLATREEFDAAEHWFRQAAAHGQPRAMSSLASLLAATGRTTEAQRWAEQSAEIGEPMGMLVLGSLQLAAGDSHGAHWLTMAAERGSIVATRALGAHLLATDPARAADWLSTAAEAGDLDAAVLLFTHHKTHGRDRDRDDQVFRWIAESVDEVLGPDGGEILLAPGARATAQATRVAAMLELSEQALGGEDPAEAVAWLERAYRAGIPASIAGIAERVIQRLDQERDLTDMWMAFAETGDGVAMYNLGLLALRADRLDEAEGWWRRGAEAGDPWCYNKIGVARLQVGDLPEAERWFRRAVDVGDPAAMFNLGSVALARGAEADAARWFRRAQEAGHPEAADTLRRLAGS